jgi:tetratricopeptide (TPR) repeat protein
MRGQIDEAFLIYEKILKDDPNNLEALFGKAIGLKDSKPKESYLLFKKILTIDNKIVVAYVNLAIAANLVDEYEEAIEIINNGISMYPKNLDLVYHRATLIGNSGNFLDALLDYYYIIDNSDFKTNPEAFLNHQISSDIALCKTNLRNETLNEFYPENLMAEFKTSRQIKEFHYLLPAKLFGDENFYFDFGKMNGATLKEVIEHNPSYIIWAIINIDYFCVSEEVIEMLRRKGLNIQECKTLNSIKLQELENKKPNIEFDGEPPESLTIDDNGDIKF